MSQVASFYLVFAKGRRHYGPLRVRVATRSPALRPGEVPIHVSVTLPDGLFKAPTLRATIKIPDDQAPATIDAAIADNIAEQLRAALGVEVKLTVEAPGG